MNVQIAHSELHPRDFLATETLKTRPNKRTASVLDEVTAFCELSALLVENPRLATRRFLDIMLVLCGAGSAGLSLLRTSDQGEASFQWDAVSGALSLSEGQTSPRDSSICGLCLDADATVLVSQPERLFSYLREAQPPIVEALVVPLYDGRRKALGTVWLAHHDATKFCPGDARVVEQLAIQLMLALKLVEEEDKYGDALTLIEAQTLERITVSEELLKERSQRQLAEVSETGVREVLIFKDAVLLEVDHRAKNTLQMAANLLTIQSRTATSKEVREALQEAYRRLLVLARLHELLQMNGDGAGEVDMPKLLHSMADALRQSFSEMATQVSFSVSADPILLPESEAIPITLLANELITNAYKHAFPNGMPGQITLTFKRASEGAIVLQIVDNGVGQRSSSEQGGMGQKLIRTFARHLKAVLVFSDPSEAQGVTVTLTIRDVAMAAIAAAQTTSLPSPIGVS